jgi:hypothetical protein
MNSLPPEAWIDAPQQEGLLPVRLVGLAAWLRGALVVLIDIDFQKGRNMI